MIKLLKNKVKCQGHNDAYLWKGFDLNNNVCEYAVNRLSNEKETLTQISNDAGRPPDHVPAQTGFTNL